MIVGQAEINIDVNVGGLQRTQGEGMFGSLVWNVGLRCKGGGWIYRSGVQQRSLSWK